MEKYNIYQEIAERTNGDIYIGVVGPVRTGKSTFIKRFMDLLVIPNIDNNYQKERTRDELPQSATGRTIMTTEPKFVPNEAIQINVDENVQMKVRMVDCVGYLVKGALGHTENDSPRMVSTPWYEHTIPFEQAAEIGTRKVITEHSTIGLVITTDGSFTDIARENYVEAEERVIRELKEIKKPFAIILNTSRPKAPETVALRDDLEAKYAMPVQIVNCAQMSLEDINGILETVLYEFPVTEIGVNYPRWIDSLENEHWLKVGILDAVRKAFKDVRRLREVKKATGALNDYDFIDKVAIDKISLGDGSALVDIYMPDDMFYRVLSESTGLPVTGQHELIGIMKELAQVKKEYDKVAYALHEARVKGYGIVTPQPEEMKLEEPELVRQGNRFGVRLKASAPSIHLIRADIETEVSPIVGTEKQSEELVTYLLKEFENDTSKIWESNIFGKSLHELVNEGLNNKLNKMPEDAQIKLQETLQRIINEGNGGLICIIL